MTDAGRPDHLADATAHDGGGRPRRDDDETFVVTADGDVTIRTAELLLHQVEVDAHPERFDEPRPPPDDLEHAVVGVEATDIAGAQLRERRAERQVSVIGRIAEHHVRAAIDELADVVGQALDRPELEAAPGDRPADRAGATAGDRRREVGHARRRLGLPVHHVELGAPPLGPADATARRARGAIRPPAWVMKRSVGTWSRSGPDRSRSSNVCGTPATFVTPWARSASVKHGSTTEASVSTTDAPAARCECSTDRP